MRRALIAVSACLLPLLMFCARCGDAPAPATDAAADVRKDSAVVDTGVDASLDDAASEACVEDSDWPGWRRLRELAECTHIDVSTSGASLPAISWVPCTNAEVGCLEIDTSAWQLVPTPNGRISSARVATDSSGTGRLRFSRLIEPITGEEDVFEFPSLAPRFGLRSTASFGGYAVMEVGESSVGVVALVDDTRRYFVGNVTDAALPFVDAPAGIFVSPLLHVEQQALNGSAYLFDVQIAGRVVAVRDSGAVATDSGTERLTFPMLVATEAFAWSEHPASGWAREVRIDVSGAVAPYLDQPLVHTSAFSSDGTHAF